MPNISIYFNWLQIPWHNKKYVSAFKTSVINHIEHKI